MTDWMADAACRGMDANLFHPERGNHYGEQAARSVCAECPVIAECREHALSVPERMGFYGGLSVKQREKILGRRLGIRSGGDTTRRGPGSRMAPEHGLSGYRNGCKCEVCRSANNDRAKRYYEGPAA